MYSIRIIIIIISCISFVIEGGIKLFDNASIANSLRAEYARIARDLSVGNNLAVVGNLTVLGEVVAQNITGGMKGPSSSTPGTIPIFANSSGNVLENSLVSIDNLGNIEINGITKNGNTVNWPSTVGAANTFLASDGAGNLIYATPSGSGNVSTASNFITNNSLLTVDLPNGVQNIKQTGIVMPVSSPLAHQVLMANAVTPTNLEWTTVAGNALPTANRIIYVAKSGNDTTGDGSFGYPYASLAKAIDLANSIASLASPVTIVISPGIYVENNTAGPLTITAAGVSIDGGSATSVIIQPNTLSNTLLLFTANVQAGNVTLRSGGVSTATGLSITAGATIRSVLVTGFSTGLSIAGATTLLNTSFFTGNATAISVNNITVLSDNCNIMGTPASTGLSSTGSNALLLFNDGLINGCNRAVAISNNSVLTMCGTTFRANATSCDINNSGKLILQAVSFELNNSVGTVTNIQASGAGTVVQLSDCIFNNPTVAANNLTAIQVTNNAVCTVSGGQISRYNNALVVGTSTDTSSTQLNASGILITQCTQDIIQEGTSTLNFNVGTASTTKISINDSTNVKLAYADPENNNVLQIGSFSDEDTQLLEASIGALDNPGIEYKSSLYGTKAIGYSNQATDPISFFSLSQDDATVDAITSNRTKETGLRLASDTGVPVGGTAALRGWDITKNGSSAELTFNYQNSDSNGQTPIAEYTVLQLDGVNNQVQLPNSATQIVFDADTNLYRSAANTLKTDDNLIIGGLTANRVVITDVNKQLTSSTTTDTELGYLAGVTSPIQTQLDSKVAKAGDTMTGALTIPAGTPAAPTLNFTGSTTTGLSANTDDLSISTGGSERLKIAAGGTVSINGLAGTAGVVHNDISGNLSSSLIINADIASAAAIVDSKLATISTGGKVANSATTATDLNTANTIVLRDSVGDFSANVISASLAGAASLNVLKAGDTMTGALQLPAGTPAAPTLNFTGSITTGLSANADDLSISTDGSERVTIDSSGAVTITGLNVVGVVHTNASGTLSTSPIVNSDIANATVTNSKLATISSANTGGNIVVRDVSGNFAANMITIDGTVTNPSDVATKDYVDSAISLGLVAKQPALVASTTNIALTGLQTIDGVLLVANDRVLLVGQTNQIQNGLWLAQSGAWTRPSDFDTGDLAGQAYVLVTSGVTNAGASWLCSTPMAIIGTDPIQFQQFSIPGQTTGANVGLGAGQIFKNKTGNTLNLKTLAAGLHIDITNNADDVTLATDATDANTVSTIVARDGSGNFSAGTITAALTGAASLNVLKAGDTMTGNLNLANQSEIRLQDVAGGEYIGLNAPTTVGASYTVSLPPSAPTANQVLAADGTTPTNLKWITNGGNVTPASSRKIYVTKYGNDTTGNGSATFPYASLSKAIDTANGISSLASPVMIVMSPGTYTENNSAGPLTVTAGGVSITGESQSAVTIIPTTLSNNLLLLNKKTEINTITFMSGGVSTAPCISVGVEGGVLNNIVVIGFDTGLSIGGNNTALDTCFILQNNTAITVNNVVVVANDCTISGADTGVGVSATGSGASIFFSGGLYARCIPAMSITNNAILTMNGGTFRRNITGLDITNSGQAILQSASFELNPTTGTVTNIQGSGAGTTIQVSGCIFNNPTVAVNNLTAVNIVDDAVGLVTGGEIRNYQNALTVGLSGDTSSTQLEVSALVIIDCTNDIIQQGTSTLNFNAGTASTSKISIDDSTNVQLAYFDPDDNNVLQIGRFSDTDTKLLQASTGTMGNPEIDYKSSLYTTQAIGYVNETGNPTTWFTCASDDAKMAIITRNRAKEAALRLVSDTGGTVGGTSALRGWDITKNGSTAQLAFSYQNSDSVGQAPIAEYTVMQLDGVNNQIQLPDPATQIVFDSDTNLYRSAANTLKTDDNLIIEGLTANRVVITDANKQLTSSATTDTELSYLAGVTSPIQTQLDSKVAKAGDTMTGALTVPAGTPAAPTLNFTGSTTTGLSANTDDLSIITGGSERIKIAAGGTVSINNLTTAGVVHNDTSGNLSSSLITNADVSASAAIVDTKLATISTGGKVANSATTATSANTASAIVARDASGNFSAGTITATLAGSASGNLPISGGTLTGTLVIPAGSAAAPSLQFTGSTNTGLAATPANTLLLNTNGTNRISISSAGVVTMSNLAGTAGIVHADASGNLTNSLIANADVAAGAAIVDTKLATISTAGKVANSATTATSANTANAIVARDGSGNFNAGTITANLTGTASGNVATTGGTMSGTLTLPAGTAAAPSLQFTGSTNTGLAATPANTLLLNTNGTNRISISSTGVVTMSNLAGTAGVVHSDASGNLTNSLIANADVAAGAAIVDTKLATISTAGKVANSATTATSANTANTIVVRDGSGNFSAGTITANLTGNVTGSASNNVLKTGDTMTGSLVLPDGDAATPSLQFTSSLTTGIFSEVTDTLAFSTAGLERMNISPSGIVSILGFVGTAGVVKCNTLGELSRSLIANADVAAGAAIVDTKLATISTAGKVANSATTATSANTANAIVARDGSGNFSAGTITANLTGTASGNVATTGGTMSGSLTLPAGTAAAPSLQFTGSTNTGLAATPANTLLLNTNGTNRMSISSTGVVSVSNLAGPGVIHSDASGNLSDSLIVNADVDAAAAIADTKLGTIATAGKVSNSATTATNANTANAIVARDASGNFSAGTITAALTGAASLNVLKAGDTMTGTLVLPAGTAAAPTLQFTGSTNTGISAATANTLSFDTSGVERMRLSANDMTVISKFIVTNLFCNQAIQAATPTTGTTVTVAATTSVLILTPAGALSTLTIALPAAAGLTNGQTINIACTQNVTTLTMTASGSSIANAPTAFTATLRWASFIYYSTNNVWYRIG